MSSTVLRCGLILSLMVVPAGDLCSESVSLQTYYPAPSGAFTQLITTQNSFIARDGGALGIGTAVVQDASLKLSVLGNVGVNQRDPAAKLDVKGLGGTNIDFISSGKIQTGDGNLNGAVWFNSNAATSGKVGANGATMFGIYNGFSALRPNWPLTVSSLAGNGNVGINTPPSGSTLDVNGTVIVRDATCNNSAYVTAFVPGPNPIIPNVSPTNTNCPAGTYATWASGLMTYTQHEATITNFTSGSMLCCPCPSGNCISSLPP